MSSSVLVVDDRVRPRRALASELEDAGYAVAQAKDGDEGWKCFCEHEPDLVITDLVMPRCDGHTLLGRIRTRSDVPVIVFTAHGSLEAAVAALKAGADEFVAADEVDPEALVELAIATVDGQRDSAGFAPLAHRIAGSSRLMRKCRSRIMGLAPLRTPALVLGERGTGRSAVIGVLHELGATGQGELFTIDCGSWVSARGMPRASAVHLKDLGALSPSASAFFLDRIKDSERTHYTQGPRIFASGEFLLPAGGEAAATRDLRIYMSRLALALPPLRDHREDIPEIATQLLERLATTMGRRARLSPSAKNFLSSRPWPGNVAELEGFLQRAVAFSHDRSIRRELLVEIAGDQEDGLRSMRRQQVARDREELLRVLSETGGNISHTAERMGRSRAAIYRLIAKFEIPLGMVR